MGLAHFKQKQVVSCILHNIQEYSCITVCTMCLLDVTILPRGEDSAFFILQENLIKDVAL